MKNWEEKDSNGVCQSAADYEDVVRVCDKIGIPYYSVNFSREYGDNVFAHCIEEFKKGKKKLFSIQKSVKTNYNKKYYFK